MRKLIKTEEIEQFGLHDITVKDDHCFELANGVIAHNSMFPKAVVSGGTGGIYSADNIWIIGRQQDKAGTTLNGYNFVIRIEKSRFLREGSKIPINVSFTGGIRRFSGLLQVALDGGYVEKPKNGWYVAVEKGKYVPEVKSKGKVVEEAKGTLTKSVREKDTFGADFWKVVFEKTDFASYIEKTFKIANQQMIEDSVDEFEDYVEPEDTETDVQDNTEA